MSITPEPPMREINLDDKHGADIAHAEEAVPGTEMNGGKEDQWARIKAEADEGEAYEHSLTIWQSVKRYRSAIFWSCVASLSIISEGCDQSIGQSFNSLEEYRRTFGNFYPAINDYQVPASWQSAIGQGGTLGNFIGIPWGAFLVDRLGYRKALLINYALIVPFISLFVFAQNKAMLLSGGILCGIPWGVFSTLAAAYASEVCPLNLRPYLTGWINCCWVIGLFLGNGITNATLSINSTWAFRTGYATQWFWPFPLFAIMWFAPESPWWLVRHGKLAEAEKSIQRLASKEMKPRAKDTVAQMVRTNQLEIDVSEGTTWLDCFRGTDRRRTEIAIMAFAAQNLCGDPFTGNIIYFFEQSNISQTLAFRLGLGDYAVLLGVVPPTFWLMARVGRRTLYIWGLAGMFFGLLIIGGLGVAGDKGNSGAKWGTVAMIYAFNIYRVVCIGPVCYSVVAESSSTRLRNKTVALARFFFQIITVVAGVLTPYMLNPSAWGWSGKTGFFWAPICGLTFVWAFFRLPEFKDRSYYELDVLFERRISARKFRQTEVELEADEHIRAAGGIPSHNREQLVRGL